MSAHSQENGSEQPQSTPDASTPSSVGGEAGPSAANERTSSEASHHTGGSRPVPPTLPEEDDIESEDDLDEHLEPPAWDGIRRRKRVPGDTRIRPAYYYPTDGNTSSRSKARGVPVFEPTWDEFKDFYQSVK